jgi:hypothetical protein
MNWGHRAAEYAKLLAARASLLSERGVASALSEVGQELQNLEGVAAAAVCGSDDEVRFMLAALAEPDGANHCSQRILW